MPGTTIEWSTNDTNIIDLEINNIFSKQNKLVMLLFMRNLL